MNSAPPPDRLLLWEILSELYLDNELTDTQIIWLRKSLSETGFSAAEISRTNYDEVAPVLISNLLSVAGEWAGFDQTWLRQAISRRQSRPKRLLGSRLLWRWWIDYWLGDALNALPDHSDFDQPIDKV